MFYIDPGTGALLFTSILGLVTSLSIVLKKWFIKLKFILSVGKSGVIQQSQEKLDYVIFSDDKRYWNIFGPICHEFESRKINCNYWTASSDDPALETEFKYVKCIYIGSGNKAYAKLNALNAYICLATTPGLEVYQWKKSKQTSYYAHIMHEVGGLALYKMFGMDYYDAILLSGGALEPELRELEVIRGLKAKETAVVGSPYMDSLLTKHNEYSRDVNCERNRRVVLVAPSWGKMSLFNRFGNNLLRPLYNSDYEVIVRPHPQSYKSEKGLLEKLMNDFPTNARWSWNRDNDNFDVLEKSDILISDFSGIIFDYSLVFNKPVLFSNAEFDYGQYDACWINHPTFRDIIQPQLGRAIVEEDLPNICKMIDSILTDKVHEEKRLRAKEQCWEYIGESARITVDWLVEKHDTLL